MGVNTLFWTTIAQVSTAFIGLIFVGLSIYLKNIQTAVDEITNKFDIAEQTTRVMFVSVLGSITFFILPLITSLSLIIEKKQITVFNPFGIFMITWLFLLSILIVGHENKKTRSQVELILSEKMRQLKKFVYWRTRLGKWLLYLLMPIYALLSASILTERFTVWNAENLLESITYTSIFLGLGFGIIDLYIFDINTILFRVAPENFGNLEPFQFTLQSRFREIKSLYDKYENILQSDEYHQMKKQNIKDSAITLMLSQSSIQKIVQQDEARVASDYQKLYQQITLNDTPEIVQKIKNMGKIITYKDIKTFEREKELLYQELDELEQSLENRLKTFQEQEICIK